MQQLTVFYVMFLIFSVKPLRIPEYKVLGVVEIFRHGARAPKTNFSSGPKLYFGSKRSQLTINGFRQQILLGRWLRRRYIYGDSYKLLSESSLKQNEFIIYSSPTQRAIFSSSAHLLGFLPQTTIKINFLGQQEVKTNDIPPITNFKLRKSYKEIVVNVVDPNNDSMFKPQVCRRKESMLNLIEEINKKDIFSISQKELKFAIDDILEKYGEFYENKTFHKEFLEDGNKYSSLTLTNLVDVLRQYKYHNNIEFDDLKLDSISLVALKKNRLNYFYNHRLDDSLGKKLYVSHMFSLIEEFFEKKLKNNTEVKMIMFSGHDNNIVDVISNLLDSNFLRNIIFKAVKSRKDYYFVVPPLASSIVIELVKVEGHELPFIKFLYNGDEITSHFAQHLEYEEDLGLLSYKGFMKLLSSRISDEFRSLKCNKK